MLKNLEEKMVKIGKKVANFSREMETKKLNENSRTKSTMSEELIGWTYWSQVSKNDMQIEAQKQNEKRASETCGATLNGLTCL